MIGLVLVAALGLSGDWIFEARTAEGTLTAQLALVQESKRLSATLHIDNHVLKGEGKTDGKKFEVLVAHADGSGPGHSERLRLAGELEGDKISGTYDNGAERGSWTARRQGKVR